MPNELEPISVITALELIQKRPAMFFVADTPLMNQLVELVVEDVTALGSSVDYKVEVSDRLAVIAANIDWMRTDKAAFDALWTCFVVPTPVRVNSHRSEILLAAVCDAVRTEGACGSMELGQNLPPPSAQMCALAGKSGRWLAFRLPHQAPE